MTSFASREDATPWTGRSRGSAPVSRARRVVSWVAWVCTEGSPMPPRVWTTYFALAPFSGWMLSTIRKTVSLQLERR